MNAITQNETVLIPLNQLCKSALNVRKVKVSGEFRKSLKASILAQGLLENLAVARCESKAEMYEVGGGGNRLDILQELAAEKVIKADFPVPCVIKSRDELVEASISENIHAPTHPADEFVAYKALADQGLSIKEIARRFGHSANKVRKLLKLASVAPAIIEAFRASKMDLDCVMAFTVCDDHERQIGCWKEVAKGYQSPHNIRSCLLQDALSSDDAIVKFVGLNTYRVAGGALSTDLFNSTSYILDRPLLERLAMDALNIAAEPISREGWSWVEVTLDNDQAGRNLTRITAEFANVPKKLQAQLDAKQKEYDELNDKPYDEIGEADEQKLDALGDEIDELEQKKEAYRAYTDEQKSFSGCVVSFSWEGKLSVQRGLVRKEDRKLAVRGKRAGQVIDDAEPSDGAIPAQDISVALRTDLDTYFEQAFQAVLMSQQELAFEMMVYALACSVLAKEPFHDAGLDVTAKEQRHNAIAIEESVAHEMIQKTAADLPSLWLEHDTEAERFEAFRHLGKKLHMQMLAFCVARVATTKQRQPDSVVGHVIQLMRFDLSRFWKPTKDNYFNRIKKDELLDIGAEVVGEDFRSKFANAKKGDLAEMMDKMPEFEGWLPAYLRG